MTPPDPQPCFGPASAHPCKSRACRPWWRLPRRIRPAAPCTARHEHQKAAAGCRSRPFRGHAVPGHRSGPKGEVNIQDATGVAKQLKRIHCKYLPEHQNVDGVAQRGGQEPGGHMLIF